jgi:hypothetical protein
MKGSRARAKGSTSKLSKPNNIVTIPASLSSDFFKKWCVFLRPLINLTDREMDVIACFLKHRWELSKSISDPALLDKIVMSEDARKKVIKECNISLPHFYVIMSNLKKSKIIVDNVINPRLIPNIREDDNGYFQLLILFKE